MTDISKNIKNVCRKKILIPLLLIIFITIILVFCPFITIFHPVEKDDIFSITQNDSYVNVTADTLYYSGYDLTTSDNSDYAYYYELRENHCVFVIIPVSDTPEPILHDYKFKAKIIKPNRAYKKMLSAFAKDLNWNTKDLSSISSNFIISNADYHPGSYMFLLWILLIILFISVKKLLGAVIGYLYPDFYPVCTFLGRHAQKQLINDASMELQTGNYLQINSMYITENFFIDLGLSKISVIPLNEIVWCYRLGTISFNPQKQDPEYALHFTISSGSVITVKHKTSDEALEAINAIRATGYNIIIGHSESKKRLARKRIRK